MNNFIEVKNVYFNRITKSYSKTLKTIGADKESTGTYLFSVALSLKKKISSFIDAKGCLTFYSSYGQHSDR